MNKYKVTIPMKLPRTKRVYKCLQNTTWKMERWQPNETRRTRRDSLLLAKVTEV